MIKSNITGPLLILDVSGDLVAADLRDLFDAFKQAARSGPFVVLTDTTLMASAPRAVIMSFVEEIKTMPALKGVWLGDAVVVKGAAVRFMLSTLLMVAPMPVYVKAFELRSEALGWCEDILRKSGIRVPITRSA